MRYTTRQFGVDLLKELNQGYDVVRLARWAYKCYLEHCRVLELGVREKIMEIVVMEGGAEFEMSENEIREFALDLQK
jgi:hypothetical protein